MCDLDLMAFVYSCCFWFSLRLGGIMIGLFSMIQGLLFLIIMSIAHNHIKEVQDEIGQLLNSMNLIFTKSYMESVQADPGKYITLSIALACIYIFFCLLYIYGAYNFNNILMRVFIVAELVRLIGISVVVVTWLLVLKKNTMDIGLLIGASVVSGFFLLGMFYLWVCAANLPVLINEMEKDEQAATIARLRQILQETNKSMGRNITYPGYSNPDPYHDVFTVPRRKNNLVVGSRIPAPYYR